MVKRFYLEDGLRVENCCLFLWAVNRDYQGNHQKVTLILHSSDFQRLKQKGMKVYPNKWMCLSFMKNNQTKMRLGWTISKFIGPAVVRNKLKRWYRQFFREKLQKYNNLYVDINIILKPCDKNFYKKLKYTELIESLEKGLKLIRKKI